MAAARVGSSNFCRVGNSRGQSQLAAIQADDNSAASGKWLRRCSGLRRTSNSSLQCHSVALLYQGSGTQGRELPGRSTFAASIHTVGVALFVSTSSLFQAKFPGMTERGTHAISQAIGDISLEKIRGPGEDKSVSVSSLWKDQTAVIHVLRRFGCRICRANAAELSKVLPILEANNIRVVAVGIEHLGLEEFLDGGYWNGELYIDNGKKILSALNIKSVGYLSALSMLFANKEVKEALSKTKEVPGTLKGDGLQLGATFVLSQTGETLLDFRQKNFADHPSSESILEACGLNPGLVKSSVGGKEAGNVCGDTCS